MSVEAISRIVRRLSGRGALDNVEAVRAARASVDAELSAFARRIAPIAVATDTPVAA
jgi:hypothetical protein